MYVVVAASAPPRAAHKLASSAAGLLDEAVCSISPLHACSGEEVHRAAV
uniref:Uncharacterized protein n=1 Tax=Arundo donax TaxID=35708 RepID=A0A0A9F5S6_ARUDO